MLPSHIDVIVTGSQEPAGLHRLGHVQNFVRGAPVNTTSVLGAPETTQARGEEGGWIGEGVGEGRREEERVL